MVHQAPLLNLKNNKIIGIHKGSPDYTKNFNYGTLLKYPLKDFINRNNSKNFIIGEIFINKNNTNKDISIINLLENRKKEIKDKSNLINGELDNLNKNIFTNRINKDNKINKLNEYNNKINLIYYAKTKSIYNIFGDKFVNNNKNCMELIINSVKNRLVNKCELKEGDNNIRLLIKNKLINLSYMFFECNSLKDIKGLKYLDVNEIKDFSFMFSYCSSLSDIQPLKDWNVSNGKNFSFMFSCCSSLSDIQPLKDWNISNGKDFRFMFSYCLSLSDIQPLKFWNVSNGKNFSDMFSGCLSLYNIKPLQNWKVLNFKNFSDMFNNCSSFLYRQPLQKLYVPISQILLNTEFIGYINTLSNAILEFYKVSKNLVFNEDKLINYGKKTLMGETISNSNKDNNVNNDENNNTKKNSIKLIQDLSDFFNELEYQKKSQLNNLLIFFEDSKIIFKKLREKRHEIVNKEKIISLNTLANSTRNSFKNMKGMLDRSKSK